MLSKVWDEITYTFSNSHHWGLGTDKSFHLTLYNGYDYYPCWDYSYLMLVNGTPIIKLYSVKSITKSIIKKSVYFFQYIKLLKQPVTPFSASLVQDWMSLPCWCCNQVNQTRPNVWLLMLWLFALPVHQVSWFYNLGTSLSSIEEITENINICLSSQKWIKHSLD